MILHMIITIPHLLALARKLEAVGQYNNAKLLRAAAEAISRRAAYKLELPDDNVGLANELIEAAAMLTEIEVTADLSQTITAGSQAMIDGRLPLFDETPDPFVCRTCGHIVVGKLSGKCPLCNARMETYEHFLPVYWMDNLDPWEALSRLRQTPEEVAASIEGLSEEEMNQSPKESEWSIRNAVSHLRDAQGVMDYRIGLMIEQENPKLESKAVFEWADQEPDSPQTTHEIYQDYLNSRQKTLTKLENLPLKDWWRTGQHEEFGTITIAQQVSYFATHELTHFPQIGTLVNWQKNRG